MTAIFPVNEKYRIELTDYSWQVSQLESLSNHPQGGRWRGKSWHRTFEQAAHSLLYVQVSDSEAEGMDQVIQAIGAALGAISAAIQQNRIPDSWPEAKAMFDESES